MLVCILLSYNSENVLGETIDACRRVTDNLVVVDSGSTDGTISLARERGCHVVDHPFLHYAAQRNWAQEYVREQFGLGLDDWILHVDSDEVLSAELAGAITGAVTKDDREIAGYLMRRLSYFLGRPIRHGMINPSWHLRLFRLGKGKCEDRLYDQHFIVPGRTEKLPGVMHDLQLTSIAVWTASHNRWSTAEATEVLEHLLPGSASSNNENTLQASLLGDLRMKKRWLKNNVWYKSPLLVRPLLLFTYSYFFRLGFLDGKEGLIYHFLQVFWFRFLIDAKIFEMKKARAVDRVQK